MQNLGQRRAICQEAAVVLRDPALQVALSELLEEGLRARLESAIARLEKGELVVAVIGQQGVGKSSLHNALVGRRVLPVHVDETTNVICRTRFADSEEHAVVLFNDDRVESGPATREWLGGFTDELQNPGNQKEVRNVTVYLRSPVLQSGITLTDTPGVGSLTQENMRTTVGFLPEISLGLFVVKSVPPLQRDEADFLRRTWAHSRSFIFVQNAWVNSERELEMALEYNLKRLTEIAREEDSNDPITLIPVNIHGALEAKVSGDVTRAAAEGLTRLEEELETRLSDGAIMALLRTELGIANHVLHHASRRVGNRLSGFQAQSASAKEDHARQGRMGDTRLDELQKEAREAVRRFEQERAQAIQDAERKFWVDADGVLEKAAKLARARDIKADKVIAAFQADMSEAVSTFHKNVEREYGKTIKRFIEKMRALTSSVESVSGPGFGPSADVTVEEAFEALGSVLEKLGGLGVGLFSSAALWAAGGAYLAGKGVLAASAMLVPGAGWIAAGAVLVAGWGLERYCSERVVTKLIAALDEETKNQKNALPKQLKGVYDEHAKKVNWEFEQSFEELVAQERATLRCQQEDALRSAEEANRSIQALERHRRVLSTTVKLLAEIADRANEGA